MNKKVTIAISSNKVQRLEIKFNKHVYLLTKKNINKLPIIKNMIKSESTMTEIFPGVFIGRITCFGLINKTINILIYNYRDELNIDLINQNDEINTLFSSKGSRLINVSPASNNELKSKIIRLESIHFPQKETGGWKNECYLKPLMHKLKLYPNTPELFTKWHYPYPLFTYEEIYSLPKINPVLNLKCYEFCSKKNSGRHNSNISKYGKKGAENLVNTPSSTAVFLGINTDKTLSITSNGNHRICYLKNFGLKYDIDKLFFENIDDNELEENQNLFYSYSPDLTESFYKQLELLGITKEIARTILLKGMNSFELFEFLIDNKYIKL